DGAAPLQESVSVTSTEGPPASTPSPSPARGPVRFAFVRAALNAPLSTAGALTWCALIVVLILAQVALAFVARSRELALIPFALVLLFLAGGVGRMAHYLAHLQRQPGPSPQLLRLMRIGLTLFGLGAEVGFIPNSAPYPLLAGPPEAIPAGTILPAILM